MKVNPKIARGAQSRMRGLQAEIWALIWLVLKGYTILAWRFRSKTGEVDIIARKRGVVAMVEVKQRRDHMTAGECMTDYDWRRRANTADYFMQRHPHLHNHAVRFDLMVIARSFAIKHIMAAYDAA